MKTIAEIEEDPIEFVQWAKAQIAAEHGNDPKRYFAHIKAQEAESRARGVVFVDISQSPKHAQESFSVREEPPSKS
jgi:hypothetical protein